MYARHLLDKLQDWVVQEHPLAEEQAGFREGRSTTDQCLVLQHLIEKYTSPKNSALHVAFIDLKAAFDSIPRNKLWKKLEATNIDRRLLFLIRTLHEDTSLRIRCSPNDPLSNLVPTFKGVKQGCILAPLLFNIYINSMTSYLFDINNHPPKIAGKHINALLYADDAAVISRTPVGLKRTLKRLAAYCKEEGLLINYQKTKIMTFARRPKLRSWLMDGHKIEQVPCFKYLGVVFHASGSRRAHGAYAAANAQKGASAILRFFRSRGGHYVPAALKLFNAKVLAQLLYGSQVGLLPNIARLESVQSKFIRALLAVPKCVPNAFLRLETGQLKIETRIWQSIANCWLKLHFCPIGLAGLISRDNYKSRWTQAVEKKWTLMGLSPDFLLSMGWDQAKRTLSQRFSDMDRQLDIDRISNFPSNEERRYIPCPAPYLKNVEVPKQRRAFTLARCHCLPSAVLEGRFNKTPYQKRICPCGSEKIETTEHILLHCQLYGEIRNACLAPLIRNFPEVSSYRALDWLLEDSNREVTHNVAKFCSKAIAIRNKKTTAESN